jgi:hypothetical protein
MSLFWFSATPTAMRRPSGDITGLKNPRASPTTGRVLPSALTQISWLRTPPRDVTNAPPGAMKMPEFPLLPGTTGTGSRTGTGLPVTRPASASSATAITVPSA